MLRAVVMVAMGVTVVEPMGVTVVEVMEVAVVVMAVNPIYYFSSSIP